MDRKITALTDRLNFESTILGNGRRYRWVCYCRDPHSWHISKSSRDPWTTIESARQHWRVCHSSSVEFEQVDWNKVYSQIPYLTGESTVKITNLRTGAIVTGTADFTNFAIEEEKVGMSRLSDIEARMRELEKEAARYQRFERTDHWPVGTVVRYDYNMHSGEVFTYAVLKCANEKWYWTGHGVTLKSGGSYDQLVEHLAAVDVSNIKVALPEDFKALFAEETLEEAVGPEVATKVEAALSEGVFVPVIRPEKRS